MTTQLEQPRRRRSRRVAPSLPPHLETYENSRTGALIQVACTCAIGESHNYADWREATATRLASRRERLVADGAA